MLRTVANTAGGKPDGDSKKDQATAALPPPPVQARSAWPSALRIDVELAENHARRQGAGVGFGRRRIDKKTVATRRPSKESTHPHGYNGSLAAEGGGGGDEEARQVGVAGLRADVGLADGHHARAERPAGSTTGRITRLRDLLENGHRRSGAITRSSSRRSMVGGSKTPRNVVIDGEGEKIAPGDGVPQTLGGAGGGGDNGVKGNDPSRKAVKRIWCNVEKRYSWSDQEGAATAGGGEAAVSTGVDILSGSREGQGHIKRLRLGDVAEGRQEKVRFGSSGQLRKKGSIVHHRGASNRGDYTVS